MTIYVKNAAGSYAAAAIYTKANGAYSNSAAVLAKVAGAYQNVGASPINAPSALGYTPPFTVSKFGSTYSTNFSMAAVKPTPTHTLYCGAGGNNANSGLSWALRVRSLKQLLTLVAATGTTASVIRCLVQVGQYRYSNADGGGIQDSFCGTDFSRNVIIEPCDASGNPVSTGVVASIQNQILPSFALLSSAVYVSTYTTELPGPGMWDLSLLNSKGNPQALRYAPGTYANEAAIIAGVAAMATSLGVGACYVDTTAKKVYVRTYNSRAPDANIEVSRGDSNSNAPTARNLTLGGIYGNPQTVWMDRIQLWGGNGLYAPVYEPETRNVITYWSDGATLYSGNSGVGVDGTSTTTLLRHTSWDSYGDGCNYDQSSGMDPTGVAVTRFHEISCDLQWNGNDSVGEASKNASSCHMRCIGVRVNALARYTQNRAFHDIQASRSWNLGCIARDCRQTGTIQSGAFVSGYLPNTGETSVVWLDGCQSINNGYDLEAYKGGTLYCTNMNTAGYVNDTATGGTIAPYTVVRSDMELYSSVPFGQVPANGFWYLNNTFGRGSFINGVNYTNTLTGYGLSFPQKSVMEWSWPAATSGSGFAYAYPEIFYGGGPFGNPYNVTGPWPMVVNNIGTLTATYDITLGGNQASYDVLLDQYLTLLPNSTDGSSVAEISFFPHTIDSRAVTEVATFTGGAGRCSIYVQGKQLCVQPITAGNLPRDILAGTIDLKEIILYMKSTGRIAGTEYLRGQEFGVEVQVPNSYNSTPHSGSMTVNALSYNWQIASILLNGDFSGGTTSWSGFGFSGKAVTGGKGVFTATPAFDGIAQAIPLVAGKYYDVTYTLVVTSGSANAFFSGGTIRSGASRSASGTYTERLLANTGNVNFEFFGTTTTTLTIDDISVAGPYNTP